jgi:hypothetical protein
MRLLCKDAVRAYSPRGLWLPRNQVGNPHVFHVWFPGASQHRGTAGGVDTGSRMVHRPDPAANKGMLSETARFRDAGEISVANQTVSMISETWDTLNNPCSASKCWIRSSMYRQARRRRLESGTNTTKCPSVTACHRPILLLFVSQ